MPLIYVTYRSNYVMFKAGFQVSFAIINYKNKKMKKRSLMLVLIAFIGIFAISCDGDDNDGETLAPLKGKWKLSMVGTVVDGSEQLTVAPENENGCEKDYMDLRVSNVVVFGDYTTPILSSECELATTEGTYVRSHNNLTTTIGGTAKTQDIVNLSLNELKLRDSAGNITVYTR